MKAYQVLLLIAVLITFLYVVLVVYVFSQTHAFSLRLRRRLQGLNLLLSRRCETILRSVAILESAQIAIPQDDRACFEKLERIDFATPTEVSIKETVALVKEGTSRLKALAEQKPQIQQDEAYSFHQDLLNDLERNYRSLVGLYNADVLGYNYWIRIPTVGWLTRLLGNKARASLN